MHRSISGRIVISLILFQILAESCNTRPFEKILDPQVAMATTAIFEEVQRPKLVVYAMIKGRPKPPSFPKTLNYRLTFCAVPGRWCLRRIGRRGCLAQVCTAFVDETNGLRIFRPECYPENTSSDSNSK